jgi:regulatory protein
LRIIGIRQTSPERFSLEMSGGSEIKTTLEVVTDMYLRSDMELSDKELEAVKTASRYSLCKARAMRLINQQAMSKKGLRDKLTEKGEEPDDAEKAADWLEAMGLLNDAAFGGMVVRHYAAKGYGAGRIKNELYRRGVPKELWDDALSEMPVQDDAIDKFVRSRLTDPSDRAQIKKVTDGLVRRGYSWCEIKEALERFKAELEEGEWTEQ